MASNAPVGGMAPGSAAAQAASHVRRYAVLYVFGALAALAVYLLPTVESSGHAGGTGAFGTGGAGYTPSSDAGQVAGGAGVSGPAGAGGAGAASGLSGGGGAAGVAAGGAGAASGAGGPVGAVQLGTGTTRGGIACKPGVRQIPFSQYANPCEALFTGNNGGATYNGVTGNTITIAVRHDSDSSGPNAAAVDAEAKAAGGDTASEQRQIEGTLVNYFNRTFELYGRQVKLVDFNGQGNGTQEAQSQGQAAACADADAAVSTVHAFGDINYILASQESGPFAACAARYHLYLPIGAAYFSDTSFQKWDPYVWNLTMNCSLISRSEAEAIGKELVPYPTKWAGTAGGVPLNGMQRKFATYVPNNPDYQDCTNTAKAILRDQYGLSPSRADQYNYALDVSTFPSDAQRAIIQFAAGRDTTVILACDPISPIFLTQDAFNQNYHPEWYDIGVALTDTDNWGQLWQQQEVAGHLFGLSENGSTQTQLDPNGEAALAWKAASGKDMGTDAGIALVYIELLSMFDELQAAGPILTPANIAAGTRKLVAGGGATGPFGTWSFAQYHTGIIDAREIDWDGNAKSPANGKQGTFVAIWGGQRFQLGQYPTGQPPFYGG
jgi:hypothetical protein